MKKGSAKVPAPSEHDVPDSNAVDPERARDTEASAEAVPGASGGEQAPATAEGESAPADAEAAQPRGAEPLDSKEQAARERRMWIWLSVAGVAVLAVILAAGWPLMRGRFNAVDQVNRANELLVQADNSIASVDRVVTVQLSPDAAAGAPDVTVELLVSQRELAQANALVQEASPHLSVDELTKANQLHAAIQARLTMVDRAPTILSASAKAVRAMQLVNQAAPLRARASRLETAAAAGYRSQTASAVESASVSVVTISAELGQVESLYSQAASAFPEAGLDGYVTATAARAKAVNALGQAARQWLADAKADAQVSWKSYQALASAAASASARLPADPGVAVGKGFRRAAGGAADAYKAAKAQAIAAESTLRTP
jgi:hypothetical protein